MEMLANRSIALDEVYGSWALDLTDRLKEARTWDTRFAALEAALVSRVGDARALSRGVVWAWRQLILSGGRVAIATLATELGWSPKWPIARFRDQIGLPPQLVARLFRFQCAATLLPAATAPDWGALARRRGHYDRSHPIDEFQRFAGDTPDGLVRRRPAGDGGFAAE